MKKINDQCYVPLYRDYKFILFFFVKFFKGQFLTIESPLKMMKNPFYFISKAAFFLIYLHFYQYFLVLQKKSLIRQLWLISKFMTSQTGQQAIIIHILLNISRRKDNQAMKFGQFKKYSKDFFSLKFMERMSQGDQFQTSSCFVKKLHIR